MDQGVSLSIHSSPSLERGILPCWIPWEKLKRVGDLPYTMEVIEMPKPLEPLWCFSSFGSGPMSPGHFLDSPIAQLLRAQWISCTPRHDIHPPRRPQGPSPALKRGTRIAPPESHPARQSWLALFRMRDPAFQFATIQYGTPLQQGESTTIWLIWSSLDLSTVWVLPSGATDAKPKKASRRHPILRKKLPAPWELVGHSSPTP